MAEQTKSGLGAANPERGEVTITIAGKDHRLTPTFQCAATIEALTGLPLFSLTRQAARDGLGLIQCAVILQQGLIAAGDQVAAGNPLEHFQEMIFKTGLLDVQIVLGDFLTLLLNGGRPAPEEPAEGE